MSSLGKLVALLRRAPLELTAEDIADALWLATITGPVESRRAPLPAETSGATVPGNTVSPKGVRRHASLDLPPVPPPTGQGIAEAVLPTEQLTADSIPFRSPTAPAIPDALALGRSLRPLRRRVPSPTRAVLDESATANLVADTSGRWWLPVLRPAMSRWLDLELIVEDSPSMRLWSRAIAELELLLQFNGAFRNTCRWRLTTDGPTRLFSGRDRSAAVLRDHRELFDASGRRAIVIVSDCVSPAWYSGTIGTWLGAWARRAPVAVLQVLPQRLWTRTALRRGLPVMFSATTPAIPNRRLATKHIAAAPAPGEDVIALPIMTLDASSVGAWARTVAGLSGAVPGVSLPGRGPQPGGVARIAAARPTAAARVARFRETSSGPARLLASCLAAVPINLPIVRLVRAAVVPEARDSDIAELFLGGLLREILSDDDPDRTEYDFHDGVRNLLLDFLPTGKALYVLDRVSAYIEPRIGQTRDFPARLTAVTEAGASFAQRHRSFATLAARVLERLGDDWRDAAAELHHHAGSPLPSRDANHTKPGAQFLDEKAAQYEQIQHQLPPGRNRTAVLDALIDDVVQHVQSHSVGTDVIARLYATGRAGARVTALGGCVGTPDAALVEMVTDALRSPRTQFELSWALRAAMAACKKISPLRTESCASAARYQLVDPGSSLSLRPDRAARRLAEAVLDEFARAIGVSSVRSWIEAGTGRQGTGHCVAILGRDASGRHLDFCRALGARLAAHGWKVIASRGDYLGPEVIESFLAAGSPAGNAMLYSRDMFGSNDSMRRHMIASADGVFVIAGGAGTATERDMARSKRIPVVAVGFTGGVAAQTATEARNARRHEIEDSDHLDELYRLLDTRNTHNDVSLLAEIAVRLLNLEVGDGPRTSNRSAASELYDAAGLRQWLVSAGHARENELLDTLNILSTRQQRTWFVALPGRVLCVLDDMDTRRKGQLVQFTEPPDRLLPVTTNRRTLKTSTTGLLFLGKRRSWLYSYDLFPDQQQLIATVERLIATARREQSIAEQLAYRPEETDVDRGPRAAAVLAGSSVTGDPGFSVRRNGDRYEIGAGTLASVTDSAVIAVYGAKPHRFPPVDSKADRRARLGLLRVSRADLSSAIAFAKGQPFDLPPGARGRIIAAGKVARLRCAIVPPRGDLVAGIGRSPLLEIVEPASAEVRLEQFGDHWRLTDSIHDELGDELYFLAAPQLHRARDMLEHYFYYALPLRMAQSANDFPDMLSLTVLSCPDELPPEIAVTADLEEARMMLPAVYDVIEGAGICFQLHNSSPVPLRITLVNVAASGQVQFLDEQIIRAGSTHRFWAGNAIGRPFQMSVPEGKFVAIDRLIAIGTTGDEDVRYLATERSFADVVASTDRDSKKASWPERKGPSGPERWTATQATVRTQSPPR